MAPRLRTTVLVFLLVVPSTAFALSTPAGFPDVPPSHPEHDAIMLLRHMDAIGGFEDGTFRPEQPITRAGVVQVAILASGQLPVLLSEGRAPSYQDVPADSPSAGFIERAVERGYLQPAAENPRFRPNDPATRAEGLRLALMIFGVTPPPVTTAPYADLDPASWEAAYATYAKEHDMLRVTGNSFIANAPLRRASLARVVATLVEQRLDATRPLLPLPVTIPLAIGWVIASVPLGLTLWRRARAPWPRTLGILAALLLGPVGAVTAIGHRLANIRVRDDEGSETPSRRRSMGLGRRFDARRMLRWAEAAEPQLLALLLTLGFMAVLVHAARITAATAAMRAALLAAGHG